MPLLRMRFGRARRPQRAFTSQGKSLPSQWIGRPKALRGEDFRLSYRPFLTLGCASGHPFIKLDDLHHCLHGNGVVHYLASCAGFLGLAAPEC